MEAGRQQGDKGSETDTSMTDVPSTVGLCLQQLEGMLAASAGRAARKQMGPLLSLAQRLHPSLPRGQIDRLQVSPLFAQLDLLLSDLQDRVTAVDSHQSALHPSNAASQVSALLGVLSLPDVRRDLEAALTAQHVTKLAAQLAAAQAHFEAQCRSVAPKPPPPAAAAAPAATPAPGGKPLSSSHKRAAAANAAVSSAKRHKHQQQQQCTGAPVQTKTAQPASIKTFFRRLRQPALTHTAAAAEQKPAAALANSRALKTRAQASAAAGNPAEGPATGLSLAQLRAALQADRLLVDGIQITWLRPLKRLAQLLHGLGVSESSVQVPALMHDWGVLEQELRQKLASGGMAGGTAADYARYMGWLLERPEVEQHMSEQQLQALQPRVDSFRDECRQLGSKGRQLQRDAGQTDAAEAAADTAGAAVSAEGDAGRQAQQDAASGGDSGAAAAAPGSHSPAVLPPGAGAGASIDGAGTSMRPCDRITPGSAGTARGVGASPVGSASAAAGECPAPAQRHTPSSSTGAVPEVSDGRTPEVSGSCMPRAEQHTQTQQPSGSTQHAGTPAAPGPPAGEAVAAPTTPAVPDEQLRLALPQAAGAAPLQPGPAAERVGVPHAVPPTPQAPPPQVLQAAVASYTLADLQAAKGLTWAQPFLCMAQLLRQQQHLGLSSHSFDPAAVQVGGLIRRGWPLLQAELQQGLQDSAAGRDSSLGDRAGQAAGWARCVEKVLSLQQVQQDLQAQLSPAEVQQLQQQVQAAKQDFVRLSNRLLRRQESAGRLGQPAPAVGATGAQQAAGAVGDGRGGLSTATGVAVQPGGGVGADTAWQEEGGGSGSQQPALGQEVPVAGSDMQPGAALAAAVELEAGPAFLTPRRVEVTTEQAHWQHNNRQQQQQGSSVSRLLTGGGSSAPASSWMQHQLPRMTRDPRLLRTPGYQRARQHLSVSSRGTAPCPAVHAPAASLAGPSSAFCPAASAAPAAAAANTTSAYGQPQPAGHYHHCCHCRAAPAQAACRVHGQPGVMAAVQQQAHPQQAEAPAASATGGLAAFPAASVGTGLHLPAGGAAPPAAPAPPSPAAAGAVGVAAAATLPPAAAAGTAAAAGRSAAAPQVSLAAAQRQLLQLYREKVGPSLDKLLRWRAAMKALAGLGPGDNRLDQFWHEYEYITSLAAAQPPAGAAAFLDAFTELVDTVLQQ